MKQKHTLVVVLAGMAALLCAPRAEALEKCAAKINAKDGTILVSAKAVSGTLKWGWTATTQTNAFFNAGTCVSGGAASKCTQGDLGTLLAITPPPECTLHLKDDAQTCTAFLKKCTPGERSVVEFPTRFIDHGDGTVTDTRTGLMWEKKDDSGGIHDKDTTYTWSTGSPYNPDGTTFFTFLATLNSETVYELNFETFYEPPFAGYGDWRLPSITELKGIVDSTQGNCGGGSGACIDQAVFGPTQSSYYWSATTLAGDPFGVWNVDFTYGYRTGNGKPFDGYARAVRGGL